MVSKALNICMVVESSSNLGLYLDAFRLDYHNLGEIRREKFCQKPGVMNIKHTEFSYHSSL